MVVYILVYLAVCALVAALGIEKGLFRFLGLFVLALFVTPIPVLIILLFTARKGQKVNSDPQE